MRVFIFGVFITMFLIGCEEVVYPELRTSNPKLVVEAFLISIEEDVNPVQRIRLTQTTGFYSSSIPHISGATVKVIAYNEIYEFMEISEGVYENYEFLPQVGMLYVLEVIYENQIYRAENRFDETPEINRVVQNSTQNTKDLKIFFSRMSNQEEYYLIKVNTPYSNIPEIGVISSRFFSDDEMFAFYSSSELKTNDEVVFSLYRIDLNNYNYISLLLGQNNGSGGGVFQTVPRTTVRGNIINISNLENFALGYFSVNDVKTTTLLVE